MFDSHKLDEITKRISDAIPPKIRELGGDMQKTLQNAVQSVLAKMDLVTREEFDAQNKVLARTRAMLEELEKKVAKLEKPAVKKSVSSVKKKTSVDKK